MRRPWPIVLLLVAGVSFLVIGVLKAQAAENQLFSFNENPRTGELEIADGPLIWPWYLVGAICLVAASVLYRRRQN
jgi:hypothetical protein